MISEQQFYKVQAILDGRNVSKIPLAKRDKLKADFPLRRMITCSNCGAGLAASWSKGKKGRKYGYYRCSEKCVTASIKAEKVEGNVVFLLKSISPKEQCLNLFINSLTKTYMERLNRLNKVKSSADEEIERLKELRKTLVEKNLDGVYSDEIFKEQNSILEEKMLSAQIAKDDSVIEKYDIDAITSFIKTRLADLGETYKRSNLSQIKVLLGSVFPSGLAMDTMGTPKYKINSIYQSIFDENDGGIPPGGSGGIRTHETLTSRDLANRCHSH